MFKNIHFIKTQKPYIAEYSLIDPAPMFRKKFMISGEIKSATLSVCGLGYAYYYINGQKTSDDLLTAPVSDYNKTLWYNVYDVTRLLIEGENIAAVIAGNGELNHSVPVHWNAHKAAWRDNPKFIFKLEIETTNGTILIPSDATWKCTINSPVLFNQLRSGEYFDARLYHDNWNMLGFDDTNWENAIIDKTPPTGVFRKCLCEPIREMAEYAPKTITKTQKGSYVFDFGQTMSGYIRLKLKGAKGQMLTIRYTERLGEDGCTSLEWLDNIFYNESIFQTDIFICNGDEFTWSPKFAYHGFQYIEITGFEEEPNATMVTAVFIHQAIAELSTFDCSNELFNQLFTMGKMATKSNLHYRPTDCPTREKLGWTNDAQASTEQFLTNFDMAKLLEKWYVDILDSMNADGAIACIVPCPTDLYGYAWGTGPVSDGVLFEIPYRLYLHTGNAEILKTALPYFQKYLHYVITRVNEKGLVDFGLWDWAGPFEPKDQSPTPRSFTDTLLYINFLKISIFASKLHAMPNYTTPFTTELERISRIFEQEFICSNGTCTVGEQTSVAMLIDLEFYEQLEPLKIQLKKLVEQHNYHLNCGMVGMRHLFHALNKCDLHEYAYKIATSTGFPSYAEWVENGATTLWEHWDCKGSRNHHMFSDILSWFMKTVVGINPTFDSVAYKMIEINPIFFESLEYAKGSIKTPEGIVAVDWSRNQGKIKLTITVPQNSTARVNLNKSLAIQGESKLNFLILRGGEYCLDVILI